MNTKTSGTEAENLLNLHLQLLKKNVGKTSFHYPKKYPETINSSHSFHIFSFTPKFAVMLSKKFSSFIPECGTDEAGRGCLAGPVTAAAVILPNNFQHALLNDSKQTALGTRRILKKFIEENCASFGVSHVFMEEIDQINILNASISAMHRAIRQLNCDPAYIIVDGNRFKPYQNVPHSCIIKGDGKYLSIAAASILAKTYRDAYMEKIHQEFPMYNWRQNKGYPTLEHREAIMKYGSTKYHRKSFKLLPEQLKLEI